MLVKVGGQSAGRSRAVRQLLGCGVQWLTSVARLLLPGRRLSADLEVGEEVIREGEATALHRFFWGRSGWLVLTNRRLVFAEGFRPTWLFGGRRREWRLTDLDVAAVGRWMAYSTLDVLVIAGSEQRRFTLSRPDKWAREITSAIDRARADS